ncbi:DUF6364 family protein [Chitinophaga cymbidii]|nr:DUF6364 family protein [Chitinophaga cymbidii]
MKTRLNLTIEESLLQRMKAYASRKHISLSELVEGYFERIVQPVRGKSIVDVVEKMKVPDIPADRNLVSEYYEDLDKKYGV